jgi:hypothetical protein
VRLRIGIRRFFVDPPHLLGSAILGFASFLLVPLCIGQTGPQTARQAQSVGSAPAQIDRPTLYILFLTDHAACMAKRGTVAHRAAALRVSEGEVRLIDSAAAEFAGGDVGLRAEAREYHRQARSRGAEADPAVVRSFTQRRSGLAVAAFARLKTQLSSAGYAALERYLDQPFANSIQIVVPGRPK